MFHESFKAVRSLPEKKAADAHTKLVELSLTIGVNFIGEYEVSSAKVLRSKPAMLNAPAGRVP